ncbi:hypothetical protein N0V83_008618 [Neocucurbitaria cava]|uniref:Essential protein Yae1 N-terminal domain-containing protein n=1 Tax=Neocucurbitaria cava TaxID=798079 RepID=A0A9W8Y0T8_9PLEO|nr:hypothetical protein N0V83_008618 [Neocucurbitaria cava]
MATQTDPFDTLLTLEDTLYTTAYTLGQSDGSHAGRIEGRVFGLEKGFEKFAALGALHARSVVWGARLPQLQQLQVLLPSQSESEIQNQTQPQPPANEKAATDRVIQRRGSGAQEEQDRSLTPLPSNPRLLNNITLLHSLTDPTTFSTDNTEEGVADFDDRYKRGCAKTKVIERIVNESSSSSDNSSSIAAKSPDGSPARGPVRVVGGEGGGEEGKKGKGDDSMEDFAGSRLVR